VKLEVQAETTPHTYRAAVLSYRSTRLENLLLVNLSEITPYVLQLNFVKSICFSNSQKVSALGRSKWVSRRSFASLLKLVMTFYMLIWFP